MLSVKGLSIFLFLCFVKLCRAGSRRSVFGDTTDYTRLGRISWGQRKQQPKNNEFIPSTLFDKKETDAVRPVVAFRKRAEASSSEESSPSNSVSVHVTSPIIPQDVWDDMTGDEFQDPGMVDRLAQSGLETVLTEDENEWIEFTPHKDTVKSLEEKGLMAALDDGEVLVYVGRAKKEGIGSQLPIIKTKSILPMSAQEMADLLMDSTKVKIYNKMSTGRKDVLELGENTKIVCNKTKPPIAKSEMVSITLMHSRQLQEPEQALLDNHKEGYLVVSRAVPGMMDEALADLPRNDILLGVNLLQDLGPNECLMTAVTHVYSPSIPTMLAKKLGVSSAINFVKDVRKVCEPVAN